MISQEPRACRTLSLEEGSGPSLGQGLGQQWGVQLVSDPQTRQGSPGLLHTSQDIQLVTSLPPPQERGRRHRETLRGEGYEEQDFSSCGTYQRPLVLLVQRQGQG